MFYIEQRQRSNKKSILRSLGGNERLGSQSLELNNAWHCVWRSFVCGCKDHICSFPEEQLIFRFDREWAFSNPLEVFCLAYWKEFFLFVWSPYLSAFTKFHYFFQDFLENLRIHLKWLLFSLIQAPDERLIFIHFGLQYTLQTREIKYWNASFPVNLYFIFPETVGTLSQGHKYKVLSGQVKI